MPYEYPYQNFYQQPRQQVMTQMQQPFQPQQPQQGGIIWVNNRQEADAYLVAPNSAVTLWNANAPEVYLKQADASGRPSMRVYDLVERVQKPPSAAREETPDYVTREDFDALAAKVEAMTSKKKAKEETA